jgi:hypothetical protein
MAESIKTPACKPWKGRLMATQRLPTMPHDPIVVAVIEQTIEQAFDDVWIVICEREPSRDKQRTSELATALSRKLVALVADGVTDAAELKRLVVDSLPLMR